MIAKGASVNVKADLRLASASGQSVSAAVKIAAAMVGAVVSNPTPRNTTFFVGFFLAISRASKVE